MKKKERNKWIYSILWDVVVDNTIGRIPVLGSFIDIAGAFVAYKIWGPIGFVALVELVDISDAIDGFLPLVTVAGLLSKIKL